MVSIFSSRKPCGFCNLDDEDTHDSSKKPVEIKQADAGIEEPSDNVAKSQSPTKSEAGIDEAAVVAEPAVKLIEPRTDESGSNVTTEPDSDKALCPPVHNTTNPAEPRLMQMLTTLN